MGSIHRDRENLERLIRAGTNPEKTLVLLDALLTRVREEAHEEMRTAACNAASTHSDAASDAIRYLRLDSADDLEDE